MSADLYIHVLAYDIMTPDDLALYKCNVLGSKHFNLNRYSEYQKRSRELWEKMDNTPQIWVGSVSFLKAALSDDPDVFVPDPIYAICEIIGDDLPIITPQFVNQIEAALALDNQTQYEMGSTAKIMEFLNQFLGSPVFTVAH